MPDYTILMDEIDADPLTRGYATMSDQEVADSLNVVDRNVPKPVLTNQVLEYLSRQINGTGVNQRAALSMMREFAEKGTVRGAVPTMTAGAARQSAADMIWQMLQYGSVDTVFDVTNANIQAQFTSIGPDSGNGPSVLTSAQLTEIQNLASQPVSRGTEIGWWGIDGMTVTAEDVRRARVYLSEG